MKNKPGTLKHRQLAYTARDLYQRAADLQKMILELFLDEFIEIEEKEQSQQRAMPQEAPG